MPQHKQENSVLKEKSQDIADKGYLHIKINLKIRKDCISAFLLGSAAILSIVYIIASRSLDGPDIIAAGHWINGNAGYFIRLLPMSICIMYFLSNLLGKVIKINFYLSAGISAVFVYLLVVANLPMFGSWLTIFDFLLLIDTAFHVTLVGNIALSYLICVLFRLWRARSRMRDEQSL